MQGKSYKPFQVLLFVLATMSVLALMSYFYNREDWKLGGVELRFLSWNKALHPKSKKMKDISSFIAEVDTSLTEIPVDSLVKHQNVAGSFGAPGKGRVIKESATKIYLNESGKTSLHAFFAKLSQAAGAKRKVRMLHYGDSQIEGDRMTAFIRQRMQERFGGNGPGTIPALNVYNTISFVQSCSENFERYTAFGGKSLKSAQYGAMCTAARFTPEYQDSAQRAALTGEQEGWIEIAPSTSGYSRTRSYSNVKLYYTDCQEPCFLQVYRNGNLVHEDSLKNDGNYHVLPLSFGDQAGKMKYVFKSKVSPTILGFGLEGDYGLQVDNIAMRGSSGTFFGKVNQTVMAKMYQDMNVELVIMQFGGNSVPYMKDSVAAVNYARYFKSQLNRIKRLKPGAAIIVIGPSDMSQYVEEVYETYPILPTLIELMKKYSLEAGAGYWNLYEAMGGINSMPSWVERGLAAKDYVHFSNKGASIASQLFYEAFMAEYAKWEKL
ncbi:MAG: hypothetical protein EP338_13415 [Bacteroidetes bacterium]|nr:MAG: hypothetical protein EP338_13415 [Bacteroidota bacterium]